MGNWLVLQDYVRRNADSHPDDVAVIMQQESLTYGQLDQVSNRLARFLGEAGCGTGDSQ